MKCLLVTIAIGKIYLQQYLYLFYESQKIMLKNVIMILKLLQIF